MKRVVIIGAGGHGREAFDIIQAMNSVQPTYDVLGFLDDAREPGTVAEPHDLEILGGIGCIDTLDAAYVPAVGSPTARQDIVKRLGHIEAVNLIHPEASIGSHVDHGPGLILAAGARITHAVSLGAHVHINVNATVSHDCTVGNFVTITPGAHLSGAVTVGDGVWVGIGAAIIQGVAIGDSATIGAGAAVVDRIPPGCTAVGVPARPLADVHGGIDGTTSQAW